MKTNYTGIDYGLGQSNINHDTGIRFGVIHHGEVGQSWYEDSEPFYGEMMCQECLQVVTFDDEICPNEDCKHSLIDNFEDIEPVSHFYIGDGYEAEQGFDDPDIFITKSPYFTYAQFCSPCAPGAVYLMNPVELNENNKGYCFGHDWFESGQAPYPVYLVETGGLVKP